MIILAIWHRAFSNEIELVARLDTGIFNAVIQCVGIGGADQREVLIDPFHLSIDCDRAWVDVALLLALTFRLIAR